MAPLKGREVPRPLSTSETEWQAWSRRLKLRADLHAVDQALQADLAEPGSLRALAAQRDGTLAALSTRADRCRSRRFEYQVENREGRARQCRGELKRLRDDLKAAGAR